MFAPARIEPSKVSNYIQHNFLIGRLRPPTLEPTSVRQIIPTFTLTAPFTASTYTHRHKLFFKASCVELPFQLVTLASFLYHYKS